MIHEYSEEEIKIFIEGGKALKKIFSEIEVFLQPGIKTIEIEKYVLKQMKELNVEPSFKTVKGYNYATCICLNEQVVHTPPSERKIKMGDIVSIDIGVFYKGFHTDSAYTYYIGSPVPDYIDKFLKCGKEALRNAVSVATEGNRFGAISKVIFETVTSKGFCVIPELTGHGIGRKLHEEPCIPCFIDKDERNTPKIKRGMVFAIEVIYSERDSYIEKEADNWSLRTKTKSLSACFEKSVAISSKGTLILT